MKILAIVANFPHSNAPYSGVFIYRTLIEFLNQGAEVTVIAPQKWHEKKRMPYHSKENGLNIYRPLYISLGAKKIFNFNTIKITHRNFIKSALRTSKKIDFTPEYVYSHFLMPAGKSSIKISNYFGVKAFCSLGESSIFNYERFYSRESLKALYNEFGKIFSNSSVIEKDIITKYNLSKNQIEYIPNGIDQTKFRPMDKMHCRKQLGLPENEKIVLFVGGFIERKGPIRVLEACKTSSHKLKMIFLGEGQQKPIDRDILITAKVNPNELPKYINAADVFVLPTKNEGMPNAVLEAMACQIPIVTSDIEVNKIILNNYPIAKTCAFNDITQISKYIDELLDVKQPEFHNFSYTLKKRAEKILKSIKESSQ